MNVWKAPSIRRVRRNVLRVLGRASAMPTHPFVQGHRRHLRSSDLFIASYPRSGNTWTRLLLADIIQQNAGLQTNTDLPIGYDNVIPDLDCGHWPITDVDIELPCRLFKTHSVYHPVIKNAIVVVRNPADSLCSYFHFFRRRNPSDKYIREGIDAFCLHNLDDWRIHVASYLQADRDGSARCYWMSYEQLHEHPLQVLKSAASFSGLETTDSACQTAIDNQSFAKRRAKERLGSGFHEFFFRAGQVNGGQNELRANTLDMIQHKTSEVYGAAAKHMDTGTS